MSSRDKQKSAIWNRTNSKNGKEEGRNANGLEGQKKRKSKKIENNRRKEKSVDLSEVENKSASVTESAGRRKKCKNPNCRCRERKKKMVGGKREKNGKKKVENGKVEFGKIEIEEKIEAKLKPLEEQIEWKEEEEKMVILDEEEKRRAINALSFCFTEIQAQLFFECFGELPNFSMISNDQNDWGIDEKRLAKVAKMDDEKLANLTKKGIQSEKTYKLNCTTVSLVTRKLLLKDPTLKESLKNPLMAVMRDFEQEIYSELDKFIEAVIDIDNERNGEKSNLENYY